MLRALLAHLVGLRDEAPLPTSLLLDARGQLVAVYLGRVEVDELLRDVKAVGETDPGNLADTALAPGVRLIRRRRPYGLLYTELEAIGRDDLVRFYREVARSRK